MAYTLTDRVRWSFSEAQAHVKEIIILHESRKQGVESDILRSEEILDANFKQVDKFARDATNSLLGALQDGEIQAKGRKDDRSKDINRGYVRQFGLHSGFHTSISPEQWKEGSYYENCLSAVDWEFIDIELPRWQIMTFWPRQAAQDEGAAYRSPYMQLMAQAVFEFEVSETSFVKHEALASWFEKQDVGGKAISQNLARSMATLIRPPESQRGGSKRV